jgi:hypothetical protein
MGLAREAEAAHQARLTTHRRPGLLPAFAFARSTVELVHRDGAVGARVDAGAALGAIVRTVQAGNVFEVVAAARALVDADPTGGTEVGINNGQRHG